MAEWFKAQAWKACILLKVSWVRIPLSPPLIYRLILIRNILFWSRKHESKNNLTGGQSMWWAIAAVAVAYWWYTNQ